MEIFKEIAICLCLFVALFMSESIGICLYRKKGKVGDFSVVAAAAWTGFIYLQFLSPF